MNQFLPTDSAFLPSQVDDVVARFSIGLLDCSVRPVACVTGSAAECVGTFTLSGTCYGIFCCQNARCETDPIELLTPRELEVALLVAGGYGTKAVARRLRISFHTVRVHICRIYAKLGLHKQTELAARISARFRQL